MPAPVGCLCLCLAASRPNRGKSTPVGHSCMVMDGWCCGQNALALAGPHPHSSKHHVSPAANATTTRTLCMHAESCISSREQNFQPALLSQESYENEPLRPRWASPSLLHHVNNPSPQNYLIRHFLSHRAREAERLPPRIATPLAPPRGHPPDNPSTLTIAAICQRPSTMFGRFCAPWPGAASPLRMRHPAPATVHLCPLAQELMPNPNPVSGLPSATFTKRPVLGALYRLSPTICVQGAQDVRRIVPNHLPAP